MINFLFLISLLWIWIIDLLVGHDMILNFISMLLFIGFILRNFYKSYDFFMLALFFIFSFLWVATSNFYIEFGNYIPEQAKDGKLIGSTISYIFLSSLFLVTANYIFRNTKEVKMKSFALINDKTFTIFIFLLILLYMGVLIVYGSPLLNNLERFEFWQHVPILFTKINLIFSFLFFVLGVLLYLNRASKIFVLIILFLIIVRTIILVFLAEKFTGLFIMYMHIIIGYFLTQSIYSNKKIKMGKLLFYSIPLFALIGTIIIVNYKMIYGFDTAGAIHRFMDRALGLQGHVWYGVYNGYLHNEINLSSHVLFKPMTDEEHPTGLVALMWEIAPYDLVERMRENKIRFTMGFPATVLSVYGIIGTIIFSILGGVMSGVLFRGIYSAVRQSNILMLVLLLLLYRSLVQVFLMGDIFTLYKPVTLLACFAIIFLLLLSYINFTKDKNV